MRRGNCNLSCNLRLRFWATVIDVTVGPASSMLQWDENFPLGTVAHVADRSPRCSARLTATPYSSKAQCTPSGYAQHLKGCAVHMKEGELMLEIEVYVRHTMVVHPRMLNTSKYAQIMSVVWVGLYPTIRRTIFLEVQVLYDYANDLIKCAEHC